MKHKNHVTSYMVFVTLIILTLGLTSCGGNTNNNPESVTIPSAPGANFKMPDTNQTRSYTTTFGEDHDYTINLPSYTDNANGTITDNVTGLIWQEQGGGIDMAWADAIMYCDTLVLGGETDWRLPSRIELISIVDYGVSGPSINTTYFPSTSSSYYWSSTKGAYDVTWYAWRVEFYNGSLRWSDFMDSHNVCVRCVRGGQ